MLKTTSIKKARTERGNRRVLFSAIFITVLLLLVVGQILADDVLLLLPKNFDVVAQRGWTRNVSGYTEWDSSTASKTFLQFRGNKVTAGTPFRARDPVRDGGVVIIKIDTRIEATYDKGHLSGTYESSSRNWYEGVKDGYNGEYMRVYYKGTVTGEANADGILKVTVQITEDTTLDNQGGGWKKRDQKPNFFSWGAEFKLPVGELQSSQKFISNGKKPGEQTQGEETPSGPDTRVSGSDQSSSSQEGPAPVTPGEAAAGAGVVGAIAAVGAWLTMLSSGVRPKDVMDALGGLFGMGPPPEPVAEPPAEPPRILFQEPPHRDGEVNEKDEVWSAEINGWLGRNEYEKDNARRDWLADKAKADLHSGQSEDVKEAYDNLQESKRQDGLVDKFFKERDQFTKQVTRLIASEALDGADQQRIDFLERLREKSLEIDVTGQDHTGAIEKLYDLGEMADRQERGFQQTYYFDDAMTDTAVTAGKVGLHGGALALDVFVTKGYVTSTLHGVLAAHDQLSKGTAETPGYGAATWEGAKAFGKSLVTFRAFDWAGRFGTWLGGEGKLIVLPKLGRAAAGAADAGAEAAAAAAEAAAQRAKDVAAARAAARAALREGAEARAMAKLGADHPAMQIGRMNETLGNAGTGFNARLVTATRRLDPKSAAYQDGIDALSRKIPDRFLTPEARKAVDAVRHDLDLASRERALELMYKEHPELEGTVKGFSNTGSHARKGLNYRDGASDIDYAPEVVNSARGREAARLMPEYQKEALKELSRGKVTPQDLKINCYGNNEGVGAFKTEPGMKVKNMYDQTSGRIDVVKGTKIKYSLRGDDAVVAGQPTRWSTGSTARDQAQLDLLKRDYLQKYKAELPFNSSPDERLVAAAKCYKNSRIFEAKSLGGRSLGQDGELVDIAKQLPADKAGMSNEAKEALTRRFVEAMEQGR